MPPVLVIRCFFCAVFRDAGIKKRGILRPAVYRPIKLFDFFRHQQRNIPCPAPVQPECLRRFPEQLCQFPRLQPGAVSNFAELFVGLAPSLSNPDLYQIRLSTTIGSARHLEAARLPLGYRRFAPAVINRIKAGVTTIAGERKFQLSGIFFGFFQ